MNIKIFVAVCCFLFAGQVFAQNEKISITIEGTTLKDALKTIQEQTGYRFFYSDDLVDLDKRIDLVANNLTISEVIAELESKTSLSYRQMEDNLIIVVPASEKQPWRK